MITQADVKQYIETELGGGPGSVVQVELTDAQLDQSITNALRIFRQYGQEMQTRIRRNVEDSVYVQLEDDVLGVADVQIVFPQEQRDYARINIFEILYRMVFPRFPISDWYMFRSYYEMFQRVRGTEPEWHWDKYTKRLYFDCWSGPYDITYTVGVEMGVDSFSGSMAEYTQKFFDLCLARAKFIYSQVLGKYTQTIPAPGGSVNTNAVELRNEAKATEKEIVDWLKIWARWNSKVIDSG